MFKQILPIIITLLIAPTLVLLYHLFFKLMPRLIIEYNYLQRLKVLKPKVELVNLDKIESESNILYNSNENIQKTISEKYNFINFEKTQEYLDNSLIPANFKK